MSERNDGCTDVAVQRLYKIPAFDKKNHHPAIMQRP